MQANALKNKRVVVAGLGLSGLAALRLLVTRGAQVVGSDLRRLEDFGDAQREELGALELKGVRLELGGHRLETFLEADLVVKSPGIPPSVSEIAKARAAGILVIGEVELCTPWLSAPVVAISGTNGKSTTTALVGHLLRAAGQNPFVGGNLGTPVAEQVLRGEKVDATVLELSSYQIDDLSSFRADIAVLLNLSPDHLERYGSLEAYAESKAGLLEHLHEDGVLILGVDSPHLQPLASRLKKGQELVPFRVGMEGGLDEAEDAAVFGSGDLGAGISQFEVNGHGSEPRSAAQWVVQSFDFPAVLLRGEERYEIDAPSLRGTHNLENAIAAIEVARRLGASSEQVQQGLRNFPGLPHRLESVAQHQGVEWVNDSKATNIDSVEKSLTAFAGPLHLIMGGKGKGASYLPLSKLISEKVCDLYVIGEDAELIAEHLGELVPVHRAHTLDKAVELAASRAKSGECVLLAPGCASFDQFRSFEHRGEHFRQLVEALISGGGDVQSSC